MTKVSDSVEWANIFLANLMKLFSIFLTLFLKQLSPKNKIILVSEKKNELSNFFAFVSNKEYSKKDKLISGNQNVLKARFSDAQFFLNEDKKNKF